MRPCPPCNGKGKLWGFHPEPCSLCHGEGRIADPEPGQEKCHWCYGKGREQGFFDQLCTWCGGRGYRRPQIEDDPEESGPLVYFAQAGKPRTAHLTIQSILLSLEGDLRICDPYYGTGTFWRLDPIADKPIRFLTHRPDGKEQGTGILPRALAEFVTQHPNVKFKRHSTNDLHDRYIICPTELILLGHGLKDIGNKDSFIVRIHRDIAADTIDEVAESFERKWAAASDLA